MMFDPNTFGWPQWVMVWWVFVFLALSALLNGKESKDSDGKPRKFSFPVALVRAGLLVFVLIYGGFFA